MAQVLLPVMVSPILLIGVWIASKGKHPAIVTALLSAIAFGLGIATGSELLLIQSVITGFCTLCYHSAPSRLLRAAIVAFLLSLGIYLFERVPDLIHAHRMREANPLRSIASRLDYERRAAAQLATTAATQPKPLWSASVRERLAKREEEIARWNGYRRHVLESLHDRTREQFILSPEFGRVRVPPLRSSRISLPESPLIPLPGKERQPLELPADSAGASSPPAFTSTVPPAASLESLHAASELDFLDPRYFGFVADIDHVAGFVSHRFSESPTLSFSGASRWRLVRLELVSLLKHDVPMAYVSEHLPNMDELKDAPTRPLEPFEEAALAQLRMADDVIIEELPGQVKMLGSLRAASRCVECHAVKRGELLGALTYRLVLYESASTRRQLEPPET